MSIFPIIAELGKIRKVPQFLFWGAVGGQSMLSVRQEVIAYKRKYPKVKEIDFIIQSPGGSPADAYRIIRTLRYNFETVNVIVPYWAKSAATLLSLGATNIYMDEFGEFGPLDIQISVESEGSAEQEYESALIDEFSIRQIEERSQRIYREMFLNLLLSGEIKISRTELSKQVLSYTSSFYEPLLKQINPYNLGKKKRLLEIGSQYAHRILEHYTTVSEEDRIGLIDYLVNQCPDHSFIIDYEALKAFNLEYVHLSDELGEAYKKILQDLTTQFFQYEDQEIFAFITDSV